MQQLTNLHTGYLVMSLNLVLLETIPFFGVFVWSHITHAGFSGLHLVCMRTNFVKAIFVHIQWCLEIRVEFVAWPRFTCKTHHKSSFPIEMNWSAINPFQPLKNNGIWHTCSSAPIGNFFFHIEIRVGSVSLLLKEFGGLIKKVMPRTYWLHLFELFVFRYTYVAFRVTIPQMLILSLCTYGVSYCVLAFS